MNYAAANIAIWVAWYAVWLVVGINSSEIIKRESFRERLWHLVPLDLGIMLMFSPIAVTVWIPLGANDAMRVAATIVVVLALGFASLARYYLGKNWSGLVAIKRGHQLVTAGPYRYMRHPIYAGLILAAIATSFSVNSLASFTGAMCFTSALLIKQRHEEKMLAETFDFKPVKRYVAIHGFTFKE